MKAAVAIAGALCITATVALATPPQIVAVTDRLFARNAETVFILRTYEDNRGRHDVVQTDTILIFRDLAGGSDLGFRGVARVIDWGSFAEIRAEAVPLPHPADPYQIRADHGAWPLTEPVVSRYRATIGPPGLLIGSGGEVTHALGLRDLRDHLADTLLAGRRLLPLLYGEGGSDPFDAGAFEPLTECQADLVEGLDYDPAEPVLARIICEDVESGQQARLWVVVPPNG